MDPLTPKDPPIIIATYLQNSKPIFWKIGYPSWNPTSTHLRWTSSNESWGWNPTGLLAGALSRVFWERLWRESSDIKGWASLDWLHSCYWASSFSRVFRGHERCATWTKLVATGTPFFSQVPELTLANWKERTTSENSPFYLKLILLVFFPKLKP